MRIRPNSPFLILTVIIVTAAAAWYSFYSATFVALTYNDAMDYASIARNVAEGEGFISSYITPLGLAHREGLPHPNLWRAPGWPVALAAFIKIFGPIDQAAALASGFFYLAAVPLIFLLARQLFGTAVAVSSSLLYILSARNLHFSLSGLTEPMALFMLLAVVFIMYMPYLRNTTGDALLGLFLGLFYLSRYNALLFVPVIGLVWFLLRRPAGVYAVLKTMVVFALTVLPWMLRNIALTGSPLFSLQKYEPVMFTGMYPGYTLYTIPEKVKVAEFIQKYPGEMWEKIAANWHEFTYNLFDPAFTGINLGLFSLFLLSLFLPLNERQKWLRPLLAACFGLQLAALMVIHYIPRLFFMFMPFYIIYGMAAVVYLVGRLSRNPGAAAGNSAGTGVGTAAAAAIVGVLTLVFTLGNLPDWQKPNVKEPLIRDYAVSLRKAVELTTKNELVLSNDGHILAWYGNRYAAKLPHSPEMLSDMAGLAPVKLIYLSGRMSWNIPEADEKWRRIYWGKPRYLYDFRLKEAFADGSLIYIRD